MKQENIKNHNHHLRTFLLLLLYELESHTKLVALFAFVKEPLIIVKISRASYNVNL